MGMFENQQKRNPWIRGVLAAVPIILGYLPVGFAYGVLAQKAGLSTLHTLLMSFIVFAGSAQLIVVGLISSGINPLSIIMTTFIVNLRHLLMSAALFPNVTQWKNHEKAAFAFELTDETFALHSARFEQGRDKKSEVFAINLTAHIAWIIGSGMGALGGKLVVDVEPFALDFVLPAMFIALLVMQIKHKAQIWVAIIAGLTSVWLLMAGLNQLHVILATIIGATCGVWIERWKTNS